MQLVRGMITALFAPTLKPTQGLVVHEDAIQNREPESFPDTSKGVVSWKTLISAPHTATDSLTVGIAACPPREGHLCPHRHIEAEVYHIISGRGMMRIDDYEQEVSAGSVIYIPGNAEHGIRNEDPQEELKWLYVFGTDSFQDIKYRF